MFSRVSWYAGSTSGPPLAHTNEQSTNQDTTHTNQMTPNTDADTRTESRYTCTENTGTAAVPDLRPDRDERDDMDELVWSHRL